MSAAALAPARRGLPRWLVALFAGWALVLLAGCDRPNEDTLTALLQAALRDDLARLGSAAGDDGHRLDPRWLVVTEMQIESRTYIDVERYWSVMTSFQIENGPFRRRFGAILRVTKRDGQWYLLNVERRWVGD